MPEYDLTITPELIEADIEGAKLLLNTPNQTSSTIKLSVFHSAQAIEKILKMRLYSLSRSEYQSVAVEHHFAPLIVALENCGDTYFQQRPQIKQKSTFLSHCNGMRYGFGFVAKQEAIDLLKLAEKTYREIIINPQTVEKTVYTAKEYKTDNAEFIKAKALFQNYMKEAPLIHTPDGFVNPDNGYEIKNMEKNNGAICLTVAMLERCKNDGDEPDKRDICRLYIVKKDVYDEKNWKQLQKKRAAKSSKEQIE